MKRNLGPLLGTALLGLTIHGVLIAQSKLRIAVIPILSVFGGIAPGTGRWEGARGMACAHAILPAFVAVGGYKEIYGGI